MTAGVVGVTAEIGAGAGTETGAGADEGVEISGVVEGVVEPPLSVAV